VSFKLVPAISEQCLNVLLASNKVMFREKDYLNGYDLNWWTKNAPYQVDAGLLSAYYLYMRTGEYFTKFREQIQFPADKLFILDSGGYELLTQQHTTDNKHLAVLKNLNQLKVLRIQEANVDIGFILDRPPFITRINEDKSKEYLIHSDEFFDSAMKFTASNTAIATANRSPNSKLRLYGVLQGMTYSHLQTWYDSMKHFPVDGWALAPKPLGEYNNLMMYIGFVFDNKINIPIHFLGSTNFTCLALMIYFSQYYPHLITSDSTSWNTGAKYRKYNLLVNNFQITIGQDKDITEQDILHNTVVTSHKNSQTIALNFLPCDCPICQNCTPELIRSSSNAGTIAVSLHNLYQQKLITRILTSLISHPPTYIDFVLSYIKNSTTRNTIQNYFTLIDDLATHKTTWNREQPEDMFA